MREDGLPSLRSYETESADGGEATWVQGKRGYCDRGYDCDECFLLRSFVEQQEKEGARQSWECKDCAFQSVTGEVRANPGYYTSRMWQQGEPHCDKCGEETTILQLVLRAKG